MHRQRGLSWGSFTVALRDGEARGADMLKVYVFSLSRTHSMHKQRGLCWGSFTVGLTPLRNGEARGADMLKVYAFCELAECCHHGEQVHFVVFPAAPETTCCSTSRCGRGCTRKSLTLGPCCTLQATGKEPCSVIFAYKLSLFSPQKCQVKSLAVLHLLINLVCFLHKSVR